MRLTETPDEISLRDTRMTSSSPSAVGFGIGHGCVAFIPQGTHIQLFFGLIQHLNLTSEELGITPTQYEFSVLKQTSPMNLDRIKVYGDTARLRQAFITWASRNRVFSVGMESPTRNPDDPDAPQRDFWEVSGRAWQVNEIQAVSVWRRDVRRATADWVIDLYRILLRRAYGSLSSEVVLEVYGCPAPFHLREGKLSR